jgi:predicted transcriptional regulator
MVAFQEKSIRESRQFSRRGNRSRTDIIADILDLCKHSSFIKKTQLMQSANLSTTMTNEYLEYMLTRKLIQRKERGYYTITERGARALHWYQRIIDLVSDGKKALVEAE